MQNMQSCLSSLLNRHKKSSTAVLFVTFFLTFCVYPYLDTSESKMDGTVLPTLPYTSKLFKNKHINFLYISCFKFCLLKTRLENFNFKWLQFEWPCTCKEFRLTAKFRLHMGLLQKSLWHLEWIFSSVFFFLTNIIIFVFKFKDTRHVDFNCTGD